MQYKDFNYMELGKKTKDNFVAGKPRYCQKCGKESKTLTQVTTDDKLMDQRFACKDCKGKIEKR